VLLAAFVVAGVVQRTLRGRFGVTLGPLSLPELADTASRAASKLDMRTKTLQKSLTSLRSSTAKTNEAVDSLRELTALHGQYLQDSAAWADRVEEVLRTKGIDIPEKQ